MNSIDYLEEIKKSNKYEYALLTTFNFEIPFFEYFILNSLANNGIKKVSVYVDAKQFHAALDNVSSCSLGRRYMVNPVRLNGAFHPKLFLLLGQTSAKLFVASANLTTSGICGNNEIVNVFEYNTQHPENLKVIAHAIELFEKLDKISLGQEKELYEEIRQLPYYGKNNVNDALFMLDSLEESILSQVAEIISDVNAIDVAVPYYDNDLAAVEELHRTFPEASIRLFLQNNKSKFPPSRMGSAEFEIYPYSKIISDRNAKGRERFYHGKVFRFECKSSSYILYGSANCTQSALTRSYANSGNIECDILEQGQVHEFDDFFEGFEEDKTPFVCEGLSVDTPLTRDVWFLFGKCERGVVRLHFGYSHRPEIKTIIIVEQEVPWHFENDEIVVEVKVNEFDIASDVFAVSVIANDKTEVVKCWILYKDELAFYRLPEEKNRLAEFSLDSNDDQYGQDRIALFNAMVLSVADINDENIILQAVKPSTEVDPENEDMDEDGGIIDYVPPSEEILKKSRLLDRVDKITWSYRSAFQNWKQAAEERSFKTTAVSHDASADPPTKKTSTWQPDASFIRFVKSNCRKMLNREFLQRVNPDRYLNYILVFFDILDRYSIFMPPQKEDEEVKKEQLFSLDYIIDTKADLIIEATNMDMSKEADGILRDLIFLTIIMNHNLDEEGSDKHVNEINRKLLFCLEQNDALRQSGYLWYVGNAVNMLQEKGVEVSYSDVFNYVDSLFGYLPWDKVVKSLKDDYGKDAQILLDGGSINIHTTTSDRIKNYFIMPEGSFRDVNNYVKVMGKYHSFSVEIEAKSISVGNDPAIKVIYSTKNLPGHSVRQTIVRRSGKRENKVISMLA